MQIHFDHLIAIFIASMLTLMLFQTQQSIQDTQMEATQYYAGRTHVVAMIDMLEHDFRNMGAGVDVTEPMILDYKWDAVNRHIEFLAKVDTSITATVDSLKYILAPSKTAEITLDDSLQTVQLYELQRHIFNGSTYTIDGVSMDTILDMEIELTKEGGIPLGPDLNETREISIKVTALSPLGVGKIVQRFRWQTTFKPYHLFLKNT